MNEIEKNDSTIYSCHIWLWVIRNKAKLWEKFPEMQVIKHRTSHKQGLRHKHSSARNLSATLARQHLIPLVID